MPLINNRGDSVSHAMALHTITPAVGVVCCCKAKVGLRRSTQGLHTYMIVITAQIESRFVIEDGLVPLSCSPTPSIATPLQRRQWVGVIGSALNGKRDSNCF